MKHYLFTFLTYALLVHSALSAELNVYFGNLHSHTKYSDGSGTPKQAYKYARDTAKLDFLAITEHNHKAAETAAVEDNNDSIAHHHNLYNGTQSGSLTSAAKTYTVSGKFVALYGQEFSTTSHGNHVNVFEVGEVIDELAVPSKKFNKLVTWLGSHKDSQNQDAIIQFNHPKKTQRDAGEEYGADDFAATQQWLNEMGKHARLISIQNGPSHTNAINQPAHLDSVQDFKEYLNLGFKLAPTCDQDNHYKNWGNVTSARTAVITDGLTKPKILEALRSRHAYATQDKNLKLIFRVQGQLCGDVITALPASGSDLDIKYSITDDDEPDANYQIEVWSDNQTGGDVAKRLFQPIQTQGNNSLQQLKAIEDIPFTGAGQYVLFKIIQENEHDSEDVAWTAPVWFETAVQPVGVPIAGAVTQTFIASINSPLYHISEQCGRARNILPINRITGPEAKAHREQHQGCPTP